MKKNQKIQEGAKIHPSAQIGENVCIDKNSIIEANVIIENSKIVNSTIKQNSKIYDSKIIDCTVGMHCLIGPYSHLRNNTIIGNNCKIGNFVEVKNSKIGDRTKACHLSYIGDAEIGEDCNIGCGVVFANYNGIEKFKTKVGDRVFIGCNSTIVAPCIIEDESFIAAGSTITKNTFKRNLAIARAKQENKDYFYNPYLENFKRTKELFGTDGIRGIYGKDITEKTAKAVGNALCSLKTNPKILIGKDTRSSGTKLINAFINGAVLGGADVYNVQITPTSCISYLTKKLNCDYGVMITASHNPEEYNGIKIFDKNGIKLSEQDEVKIESKMKTFIRANKGNIFNISAEVNKYEKFLNSICQEKLDNIKIVLDCANGASKFIVPKVFKKTKAKVILTGINGKINNKCGCTYIENLRDNVEKHNAHLGFAFDGDADRVVCVNGKGEIIDGDKIIYLLALWKQKNGENIKTVVGTIMTNNKVEELLNEKGINLIRTDVGDKNIIHCMLKNNLSLGGEQAGHIIMGDKHPTGDGVLTALALTNIYIQDKNFFEKNTSFSLYPQKNADFLVESISVKTILKNDSFKKLIEKYKREENCRIVVRPSGTEPKIRIMVEAEKNAEQLANKIKENIKKIIASLA